LTFDVRHNSGVALAEHRTILVVDVVGFSSPRRTNVHHEVVRAALYRVLEQAFSSIGVQWDACEREDRGDGVLVAVPPTISKSVFVDLPSELVSGLRVHNAHHQPEEQIRLRMALHAGEVHYDPHGVIGRAVILAFRLLDSQVLRDATADVLGVIVSSWFYDEVIWHTQPAGYRRVEVEVKETRATAWIWVPDSPSEPQSSIPRQLPTNVRQFVGRSSELDQLMTVLNGTVIITAIDGSAGIGKTTLALHWAHHVKDRFPDGHLHVDLRGFDPHEPMDPGQALHDFLHALGVSPRSIPPALEAKAALYRSKLADRRMLIMLDNARSSDHVRPLLPGSSSCITLITSRSRLDSLAVREGVHRISLDVLSTKDSLALLAERVQHLRVTAEPAAANELVELCAQLPLALSIVAARAAEQSALSLRELVREVQEEHSRLDFLDSGDIDVSVRSVFSWSYNLLSPDAARLFRYLGVHPGPDIDLHACNALVSGSARVALNELTRAHMVTEHEPRRFRFHDLLRAYASEQAETEAERVKVAERMLDYYLAEAEKADIVIQPCREGVVRIPSTEWRISTYAGAMAWFTAEHAVLLLLVALAAERGFTSHTWRLAWACTTFLRRDGRFADRIAVHRIAASVTSRVADPVARALILRLLGRAVARLGHFTEALDYLREAAMLSAVVRDNSAKASVHLSYSKVFELEAKYSEALAHAQCAWELARQDASPLRQADALHPIGRMLVNLGRYREALPYCEGALAKYTEVSHEEGKADALVNIGDIHRNVGNYPEAIVHYQKALHLDRELRDRYWEAKVLERMGQTYATVNQKDRAHAAFQNAIAIFSDIHSTEAERVAELLRTL
jgi:tetratricopeptide (TPR) repeat protein